jgi:trk system potassium uptake protein TrkA
VAAIFRAGRPIKPEGSTVIQADDEVFFLADARNITTVMSELRRLDSRPTRRLMIAGGGNIGRKLARNLENRYQVKVLEKYRDRARPIARNCSTPSCWSATAPTRTCCARRTSTRPTSTWR